jgi:hypothetical protein
MQLLRRLSTASVHGLQVATDETITKLSLFSTQFTNTTSKNISEHQQRNESIVPCTSENDHGSIGFKNSSWRKSKFWRNQFSTSSFLPRTSSTKGLFGNVVLDVREEKHLNKIVFDTKANVQHYMIDFNRE